MSTPVHAGICVPRGVSALVHAGIWVSAPVHAGICLPSGVSAPVHAGISSGSRGVPRGPWPPTALKMAAKGGHIDFMFLAPPHLAAGSDARNTPSL